MATKSEPILEEKSASEEAGVQVDTEVKNPDEAKVRSPDVAEAKSPDDTEVKSPDDTKAKNPRAVYYKKPIKKDNMKLDVETEESAQEVRRQRLLYYQKKNRQTAFNESRGILEKVLEMMEEEVEEEEEEPEAMELDEKAKPEPEYQRTGRKRNRYYANQLMLSEWMIDVPQDFADKWIAVPCPKGQRILLVACKGMTKAYTRRGIMLATFNSALPGGNFEENRKHCTILDCIWVKDRKEYYVLDVIAWCNQSLQNCDAEFRLFWLQTKTREIGGLGDRGLYYNSFPILPLPAASCNSDLEEFFSQMPVRPELDGVLFYHREAHYKRGRTPLVTWLKPYMLPEVLGIPVPEPMEDYPPGYIDFKTHILTSSGKSCKKRSQKSNKSEVSMEQSNVSMEKSDVSIEKSDVSMEKSDVSMEKSDVSMEKSEISMKKSVFQYPWTFSVCPLRTHH